jgi:hypothetical protein
LQLTNGDFAGSKLTAIGRLAWKPDGVGGGAIVSPTDILTVAGGTGDLVSDHCVPVDSLWQSSYFP